MGQQQLLLLTVAFIVVVLMVAAGIAIYQSYAETANRDNLISTASLLASQAQAFYKKPVETGGGGNTFNNWILPQNFESGEFGEIRIRIRRNRINLTATGIEPGFDNETPVRIRAIVRPDRVDITIQN